MLYKPFQMLSQFTCEQEGQLTLADLEFDFPKDVYPVGRLDADSEGLLLLTNDAALNAQLLQPKQEKTKTYWAQVEGEITEDACRELKQGVPVRIKKKQYRLSAADPRLMPAPTLLPDRNPPIRFRANIPTSWLEIELTEGKNRQVRRMCAAVGFPVLRLVRSGFGGLFLGQMPLWEMQSGEVRELTKPAIVS